MNFKKTLERPDFSFLIYTDHLITIIFFSSITRLVILLSMGTKTSKGTFSMRQLFTWQFWPTVSPHCLLVPRENVSKVPHAQCFPSCGQMLSFRDSKKHLEIMSPKAVQLPVDQLPFCVDKFIRGLNAENNLKDGDIVIMNLKWKNSQLNISS